MTDDVATITLPEHVKRLADSRAATSGYARVDEYVQALILADAAAAEPLSPELEDHLLRALQTPSEPMLPGDWDEMSRELRERFGRVGP